MLTQKSGNKDNEPPGLEPHTLPEIDHEIFKAMLHKKEQNRTEQIIYLT